jgi:hypothetical protein
MRAVNPRHRHRRPCLLRRASSLSPLWIGAELAWTSAVPLAEVVAIALAYWVATWRGRDCSASYRLAPRTTNACARAFDAASSRSGPG